MKAKTLKLIEKLARDVRRGDELCDYNPVFMELFGSLFLTLSLISKRPRPCNRWSSAIPGLSKTCMTFG